MPTFNAFPASYDHIATYGIALEMATRSADAGMVPPELPLGLVLVPVVDMVTPVAALEYPAAMAIVVIGAGKSTVGRAVALVAPHIFITEAAAASRVNTGTVTAGKLSISG